MLTIKRLEEMNKNRTALVCGSTQGIGFAVANQLAKNGYNLILMARNEEKLNSALARMDVSQGQHHQYLVADFSKPTELKSVIDAFIQKGNRIHVLVNNTGGPKGGLIKDAAPEEFINTFNQHLICNHILMQAVNPGMIADGYGRIMLVNLVNTESRSTMFCQAQRILHVSRKLPA